MTIVYYSRKSTINVVAIGGLCCISFFLMNHCSCCSPDGILFLDKESNFWSCRKCWNHYSCSKKRKQNWINTFSWIAKTFLYSFITIKITGTCFKIIFSTCDAKNYFYYCNILFLDWESNFWWCRKCGNHICEEKEKTQNYYLRFNQILKHFVTYLPWSFIL